MGSGSGALKGAAGGAAAGAALGPWGAAAGGVLGGIAGYFGSDDNEDQQKKLEAYRQQILQRTLPELDNFAQGTNLAQTSGFASGQGQLINRLQAISSGQGPSIAQSQLNAATERNTASQLALAGSGRGNATLANIVAANNIGNLGAQASQQAVTARLQEQQMANQLLGGTLAQARSADEANAQFNAQQQNFARRDALEAKLKLMGLDDQTITSILNQQDQLVGKPTLGDQLLAGGAGALGQYASQNAASKAAAAGRAGPTVRSIDTTNPYQA